VHSLIAVVGGVRERADTTGVEHYDERPQGLVTRSSRSTGRKTVSSTRGKSSGGA
jgi:hypothetical protein